MALASDEGYLDPAALTQLMSKLELGKELLIVDVRDEDRNVGWIKGSTHMPSGSLTPTSMARFAELSATASLVVFHCQFSQVRGPKARRMFESILEGATGRRPQSAVLRGGYENYSIFARNSNLEKYLEYR